MKKITVLLVLTLCMGLIGCSSGNTDKRDTDAPVPVQTEKNGKDKDEKKLTVYDYYNSEEIQETVAGLVDMDVFNDSNINTADGLFSLIYKDLVSGSLIDDKCTLIQYQSPEDLWFIDVSSSGIKTSEWLTYIIGEKIYRFEEDDTVQEGDNRFIGKLSGEKNDYYIGYEYTNKENEYRIFALWDDKSSKEWFFLNTTIEERVNFVDKYMEEAEEQEQ